MKRGMAAVMVLVCTVLGGAPLVLGQPQGVIPRDVDPFGVSRLALQRTWTEKRAWPVILQRYDEGCGPAALATVFRFLFDLDVTEEELLQEMLLAKVGEGTTTGGFSFRDLIGAAERRGYETLAGRAPLEELSKLNVPAIVLVERNAFRHFVILWGVVDDRVYLGDPLIGNTSMPLSEFAQEWVGVLLIVLPPDDRMEAVMQRVQHHISEMEKASLGWGDAFRSRFTYRSLVDQGMALLVPTPGEF